MIDVLVLYTEKAMLESASGDGAGRTIAQMESDIATAYQGANNALSASGIDFSIRIVHMEQVLSACMHSRNVMFDVLDGPQQENKTISRLKNNMPVRRVFVRL